MRKPSELQLGEMYLYIPKDGDVPTSQEEHPEVRVKVRGGYPESDTYYFAPSAVFGVKPDFLTPETLDFNYNISKFYLRILRDNQFEQEDASTCYVEVGSVEEAEEICKNRGLHLYTTENDYWEAAEAIRQEEEGWDDDDDEEEEEEEEEEDAEGDGENEEVKNPTDELLKKNLDGVSWWNEFARKELLREFKAVFKTKGSGLKFGDSAAETKPFIEYLPMAFDRADLFSAGELIEIVIEDDGRICAVYHQWVADGSIPIESDTFGCDDWPLFLWNVRNALREKDAYLKPEDYEQYEKVKDGFMSAEQEANLNKNMKVIWKLNDEMKAAIIREFKAAINGKKKKRFSFDENFAPLPHGTSYWIEHYTNGPIKEIFIEKGSVSCDAGKLENDRRNQFESCDNWFLFLWHLRHSIKQEQIKDKK